MNNSFYITTTLPYVNAKPHIGHALEFIQADSIARWQKQQGKEVIFNVGTDEHGLKIFQKAEENKMSVQDFVDMNVETFKTFCKHFEISYSSFYRTSDTEHYAVAQSLWNECDANNDIYEKQYTGLYCVGCESFKTSKELVEGKCPDHNKEPVAYDETNYFFRLSKHRETLLKHINETTFVLPQHKGNELRNFVEDLQDISISRKKENLPWGVPVPNDDSQVMYVRFDALSNYAGAVGYPSDQEKFQQYRGTKESPNCVQICGPDNLRFQGAIRQGMLASAGLPQSKTLLVHGMILGPDGNKMSKTLGNTIDPMEQLEKFGLDAVRYYLIAGIPTFGDAAYKEEDLINLYNSHLANSFGNLLNRAIHLANKKEITLDTSSLSPSISQKITESTKEIEQAFESYDLHAALSHVHQVAIFANEYISRPGQEPWNKEITAAQAEQVLNDIAGLLDVIIEGYTPVIPGKCKVAREMLSSQEKGILFERI